MFQSTIFSVRAVPLRRHIASLQQLFRSIKVFLPDGEPDAKDAAKAALVLTINRTLNLVFFEQVLDQLGFRWIGYRIKSDESLVGLHKMTFS